MSEADLSNLLNQLAGGRVPEIPDSVECAQELRQLSAFMQEVKRSMLLMSQGGLSFELKESGPFAGAIKALQANLKHLTWQTQQVAKGDFTQHVDFMGEFAVAFNLMVQQLKASRDEIARKNSSLEKAYEELKATQMQMLQQEKMASIGQLAAGIAHEINNPVGFMLSNLSSLRKYSIRLADYISLMTETIKEFGPAAGPEGEAAVKMINERARAMKVDFMLSDLCPLIDESINGGERVKQIVQNLKSFSHVDEAALKPADINSAIQDTLSVISNKLKDRVTVRMELGSVPLTECNVGQINQVFLNMLLNAADAIQDIGEIRITTSSADGVITVSIEDTGCGIPADKMGRIFEPFFTTREIGKGTGLGLSIAYDIVKKHNGTINVVSEPGKGTTFTIILPVVS